MFFLVKNTFYGLCVIIPLVIVGLVFVKLAEILEKVAKPLGLDKLSWCNASDCYRRSGDVVSLFSYRTYCTKSTLF